MTTNPASWLTHDWFSRPLQLDDKPVIQHICRRCGRTFAEEETGERYAAHASIFMLHRLSDEVTARWLAEPCPQERLQADLDEDAHISEEIPEFSTVLRKRFTGSREAANSKRRRETES